jgi:hypothetical protein
VPIGWEQLASGVALPLDDVIVPPLTEIELPSPGGTPVGDVESTARSAVVARFQLSPGTSVAVGASSRGLSGRVEVLRGAIAGLRDLGAEPFVVPAMGSHGGATADGQLATLARLGVTEDGIGAEIRSSMETTVVATAEDDEVGTIRLYLDRHAAAADVILPVNRIKPHTQFHGPAESGLAKMAVVGFGKRSGAAEFHATGPRRMNRRLGASVAALRATGRLLGGVGTVEAADGAVVDVQALTADDVGGPAESALLETARGLLPGLPFEEIDVLVIEHGGKDISGTTIDPNVTGRFWIDGLADLPSPRVATIVLLALTPTTAGSALGIGFADFVPASLAVSIDWEQTYLNCLTAGPPGIRRGRLPMVLPDEASCVRAALATCGRSADEPKRVVRIRSTLHITRCWVSETLLAELPGDARVVNPSS